MWRKSIHCGVSCHEPEHRPCRAQPGESWLPPSVKFQQGKGAPSLEKLAYRRKHPIPRDTGFRESTKSHCLEPQLVRLRAGAARDAWWSIHPCQTSLPPLTNLCQPWSVSGHRSCSKISHAGKTSCSLVWVCTSMSPCSVPGPAHPQTFCPFPPQCGWEGHTAVGYGGLRHTPAPSPPLGWSWEQGSGLQLPGSAETACVIRMTARQERSVVWERPAVPT